VHALCATHDEPTRRIDDEGVGLIRIDATQEVILTGSLAADRPAWIRGDLHP
jgi:hypothetical protein